MSRAALLLLCVVFTGCFVANRSYQPADADPPWVQNAQNPKPPNIHDPKKATIAVIEFDDFGFPWNAQQLHSALTEIEAANATKAGAIVVTFVHGWHNFATSNNRKDFETKFLVPLAEQEELAAKGSPDGPRKVIGIYIAWRGQVHKIFGKNWTDFLPFSYYDRDAAATRIASGVSTALLQILNTTQSKEQSRSIVIGHSMGALMVERAILPILTTRLVDGAYDGRQPKPKTDLVILVNPAAQALEAFRFREDLRRWTYNAQIDKNALQPYVFQTGDDDWPRWRPLLITLTSEGDWATGPIMHAAQTLKTRRNDFSKSVPNPPKERVLARHSPANVCTMLTHVVTFDGAVAPDTAGHTGDSFGRCTLTPAQVEAHRLAWFYFFGGASGCKPPVVHDIQSPYACFRFGSDQFALWETQHPSPYWTLRVPKDVIPNHSLIWEAPHYHFLRGLIAFTGVIARPAAPPPPPDQPAPSQDQQTTLAASSSFGPEVLATESVARIRECDAPSDARISYTGLSSLCSPENPICDPNESIEFRIEAPSVQLACSEVTWEFAFAASDDASRYAFGRRVVRSFKEEARVGSTLDVTATTRNDQGRGEPKITLSFGNPPPPPPGATLAPAISIEGATSGCDELSMPCVTNEDVKFSVSPSVPRDAATRFEWIIAGQKEEQESITRRFNSEGVYEVQLTARRGKDEMPVSAKVDIRDCGPAPEFDIIYVGARSGCSGGAPCAVGEAVEFTIRPKGDVPLRSCHRIEWTNGSALRDEPKAWFRFAFQGRHFVTATIHSLVGEPKRAEIAIDVQPCVAPSALLIDFEGETSHCTRASVCAGDKCQAGEKITLLRKQPSELQPCDTIRWTVDGRAITETTSTFPGDSPRTITATVTNASGTSSDTMLITFEPRRDDDDNGHDDDGTDPTKQHAVGTHTVKRGDCLSLIAEKFYHRQDWPRLYRLNKSNIRNPDLIFPGQVLRLWEWVALPEQRRR